MEQPPIAEQPKPPRQRKNVDLTVPAAHSKKPPIPSDTRSDFRSPAEMMRNMGFCPDKNMTPLQFLIAVMNDDADLLYRQEKKRNLMRSKGIGLNYRIECAKTAAKYIHMQMPSVNIQSGTESKFADDLARSVARGEERVRTKRIIIETVERISPDVPISDANYPPAFSSIEGKVINDADAEGNTDYDPDRDD